MHLQDSSKLFCFQSRFVTGGNGMDPSSFDIPEPSPPRSTPGWVRLAEVILFLFALLVVRSCLKSPEEKPAEAQAQPTPRPLQQISMAPPKPLAPLFGPPTPQTRYLDVEDPKVYMPTGSGRIQSAHYGSTRTNSRGWASFHEGVDISPVEWKRGVAQDPIYTVADGKVSYFSKVGGNSSYGIYLVIEHPDTLGKVYTLYSHLASVDPSISTGKSLTRGDVLGITGHTSTLGIPRQRSHLHFELCLMLNPEFNGWFRSKKLKPNHKAFHGWNLVGLNPHLLLSQLHQKETTPFSFADAVEKTEVAWSMAIRSRNRPNYFSLYPSLWKDGAYNGQAFVIEASESGAPLSGRNATAEEITRMENAKTLVLSVNKEALGRNGLRHVVNDKGRWRIGKNGNCWLEILLYRSR